MVSKREASWKQEAFLCPKSPGVERLSSYMQLIDIGTVLNHFDDMVDEHDQTVKEYGIKFITSEGKIRTMRCRKNVKSPKRRLAKPLEERGKSSFNLKRNGIMLLHDLDLAAPRSVKVATFFAFKDFKSPIWLTIRH